MYSVCENEMNKRHTEKSSFFSFIQKKVLNKYIKHFEKIVHNVTEKHIEFHFSF